MAANPNPYAYLQPFAVWENVFTPAELDTVVALGDALPLQKAGVVYTPGQSEDDAGQRVTRTAWMARNPQTDWLYDRIERAARVLNQQIYQFDLAGFSEDFQYTVYHASEGGHFDWHLDQIPNGAHRKLSFSLQLSDAGTYYVRGMTPDATVESDRVTLEVTPIATSGDTLLANLSTRGTAGAGSRAMVVGFVVSGTRAKNVLLRAIGPTLGSFGVIMLLARSGFEAEELADFKGLAKRSPWYALVMTALMFSLAGVPPMMGFMAKWAVLDVVVGSGQLWLAIVAVAASLVGAFYYLRVVKVMWFDEVADASPISTPLDMRVVLSLNGILVVILGVLPGPLLAACLSAMSATLKS